jgi:hypothetical protein
MTGAPPKVLLPGICVVGASREAPTTDLELRILTDKS